MNYYEHHIGDYDADTAHLSWLEDMAYTRLMRLYYRKEAPIPADVAQACRLVRAQSKDERAAVDTVLREFFVLRDDGWHQDRCDAEVAAYQARVEHNRRVGKKGGRPRKVQPNDKPESAPPGSETKPAENPLGYFREPAENPPQTPDPTTSTVVEVGARKRAGPPTKPEGVEQQTWADWLALRKAKKAPVTQTVLAEAFIESRKAGLTLEQFLRVWCARGSQGLQADWLRPEERGVRHASPAASDRRAATIAGLCDAGINPPEQDHGNVIDAPSRIVG